MTQPSAPPDLERAADGYELDQRDGYVQVTLRGRPRLAMVVRMFVELERLTTAVGELLVLIDEGEMKVALLGNSELRAMVDALKRSIGLRQRSRIAVYAPSVVVHGLNRMAFVFAGEAWEGRLAVFRTQDEARDWLLA